MKVKIIETIKTIWEISDNFYDDKDYDVDDLAFCEIAEDFQTGKKLWEGRAIEDISWDTRVFNDETDKWEEITDKRTAKYYDNDGTNI